MYDNNLFFVLSGLVLIFLVVSAFFLPDQDKRPHRAVLNVLRKVKKSKYAKPARKQQVLLALQHTRSRQWLRCPFCGTGNPGWSKGDLVDLTDTKRNVVFSVTTQTCQRCGHVQLFSADWLSGEGSCV